MTRKGGKGPATAREVAAKAKQPGRHSLGDNLILNVSASGSASWTARVRDPQGRRREIGLGPLADVTLADAREKARELRACKAQGKDPVAEKRRPRGIPKFEEVARERYDLKSAALKNDKHRKQWIKSLEIYVFPRIGQYSVDAVDEDAILACIKPIWLEKHETARRVMQRILKTLDYAKGKKYRDDPAPRESLSEILPGVPADVAEVKHHAAMPYRDLPAFMERLRGEGYSVGRAALEFLILTAARSGEVRGARWEEIDEEAKTWTVPAERMKMGKEHVVPLSDRALAVVKHQREYRTSEYIFPGQKSGRRRKHGEPLPKSAPVLSDMTLLKVLRDMDEPYTAHGFRSSFRDWTAEQTNTPNHVAELALAHAVGGVEAAYRRAELIEKRRKLMDAWAAYLSGLKGAEVVEIGAAA